MSNKNILKIIILCTVLAIFTGAASAQDDVPPNFPVALKGSVTIGGNAAPPDTIISAKVGESLVGETKVQTSGTYGGKPNNLLPVSAIADGTKVDLYVNNIKVTTFTYYLKDAGTIKSVNLGATSQSSGTTGSSGNGVGGGGVSGAGGTPKTTAIQQSVTTTTKGSLPGTPAAGTPVTTTGEPPIIGWSTILGVFGILAIGAIAIYALKKMGKI